MGNKILPLVAFYQEIVDFRGHMYYIRFKTSLLIQLVT